MAAGGASPDAWGVCEKLGGGTKMSGGVVEGESAVEVGRSDVV